MLENDKKETNDHGKDKNDHGRDLVTIVVNEVERQIHRGHQTIAVIKLAGNVPSTDILYQLPNYECH